MSTEEYDKIKTGLQDMHLGDIGRASQGGSKMGAFILGSCLIDAIAGFYTGEDTNRTSYKAIVEKYFNRYDPENLYTDLRCKLVHSYSEGGSYLFTHGNSEVHMTQHSSGKTIINLENFISDLEKGLEAYLIDLSDNKDGLQTKATDRLNSNGILEVITPSPSPTYTGLPPVSGSCISQ